MQLTSKDLQVIDGMFWGCVREAWVADSDLPTWNKVRRELGLADVGYTSGRGYIPMDDPNYGVPFVVPTRA